MFLRVSLSPPSKRQGVVLVQFHPGAAPVAFSVQDVAQPRRVFSRGAVQLEVPDPEGRHPEAHEPAARGGDGREIHQDQIVAKRLVSPDALVVVEEVAATCDSSKRRFPRILWDSGLRSLISIA